MRSGGEYQREIDACSQSGGFQTGLDQLDGGTGVGGAFHDNQLLCPQGARDGVGGSFYCAHVRLLGAVNGCGHTYQHHIALAQAHEIHRRRQLARLDGDLPVVRLYVFDIPLASDDGIYLALIDIETNHGITRYRRADRHRQSDVAQADNANLCRAGLYSLSQLLHFQTSFIPLALHSGGGASPPRSAYHCVVNC